ncbi:hypothetical protein ACHAWF_017989 [Thalassiosira exigua]
MSPTPKRIRSQSPDVIVAVGEGESMQEFECYKLALSFASPYLDAMLGTSMAEANRNRIEFPDKDPEEWKRLYNFIDPSVIVDANYCATMDDDVAMKLTPWFHEFQMESFVGKCDAVLSEKVVGLSKKRGDDEYNTDFWKKSNNSPERRTNYDSLIQLLHLASLYDLEKTKRETEGFIKFVGSSLLGETIDLFTIDAVKTLVQLSLPLEELEGNEETQFVSRGKLTVYWELLMGTGLLLQSLGGLSRNHLCTEVISPIAYTLMRCEAERAEAKKVRKELTDVKNSLYWKDLKVKRVNDLHAQTKAELNRVNHSLTLKEAEVQRAWFPSGHSILFLRFPYDIFYPQPLQMNSLQCKSRSSVMEMPRDHYYS